MPAEFFYVILLLVVAVIFGWFYLKRAQARTPSAKADGDASAPTSRVESVAAPVEPVSGTTGVEEATVTPDPAGPVEPTAASDEPKP